MQALTPLNRMEALLLGPALVFLTAISIWFVALRCALGWPLNVILAAAIIVAVGIRVLQMIAAAERTPATRFLPSVAVIAVAVAWVVGTYWAGAVLPGHDPITVPTIADRMASGVLPIESYKPGDNAYTYPPGYPIAFIPIVSMLDKVSALTAFKMMSLLTAALIPASWAWLLTRLFPISTPFWITLLLSYSIFFGLERTLMFGAAGKNAAYLVQLLAPPTVLIMLRTSERWRDAPIGVLALFGLTLIHYSALHLVVCIIAGWALVDLVRRNLDIRCTAILALMGIAAAVMLMVLYGEAFADPRSESFRYADIPNALGSMLQALSAESNSLLVIFHEVDVLGLARSPYRGFLLLASGGITLVAWRLLRTRDTANIAAGAIAFLVAIVLALAMATQLVPARIKPEYVRWFLWTIQGGLMLSAGLAIATLIAASRVRDVLAAACALLVFPALGFAAARDGIAFRKANSWLAIHRAELQQLRSLVLHATDSRRPCFLTGPSELESAGVAFAHQSFVFGYAEFLTPCTFANGGWLRGPIPDGRALEGYPSIKTLSDLLNEGSVLFLGNSEAQNAYASGIGSGFHWTSVGEFSGHYLWRIERPVFNLSPL